MCTGIEGLTGTAAAPSHPCGGLQPALWIVATMSTLDITVDDVGRYKVLPISAVCAAHRYSQAHTEI